MDGQSHPYVSPFLRKGDTKIGIMILYVKLQSYLLQLETITVRDSSFTFQHPLKSMASRSLQYSPITVTPSGLNHTQSLSISFWRPGQFTATLCRVLFVTLVQLVKSNNCSLGLHLSTGHKRLSVNQFFELRKFKRSKFVLLSLNIWNACAVTLPAILAMFISLDWLKYSWIIWQVIEETLRSWNRVCIGSNGRIYWNNTSSHGMSRKEVTECSQWSPLKYRIQHLSTCIGLKLSLHRYALCWYEWPV
jgi:hypothetical protein